MAFLAGCTSDGTESGATTAGSTTAANTSATEAETTQRMIQTDELDLREANVMAVAFEKTGETTYRFDVTLLHDDDGEDGYANWWQVETLSGEQLGRRELLHAHGTQEFTRAASVEIPADVTRVVVRGHDQTHGYGGQAMVVDLDTGEIESIDQGSEPRDFSDD
ncbi:MULTISPECIES: hypothetical protein [unclassified Haladaptatus]|uniref:hypothetical protein n=1 Tax=unclassified Haladaptatus TaxID=2622732 RepID=UPI0023E89532|nr:MULTISPECIES: hypothetical protein [unclassified Haladaptatus]